MDRTSPLLELLRLGATMSRLMIDVDDTIADTQKLLIEKINPLTDHRYSFEGMTRGHRENAAEFDEWNDHVRRLLKMPNDIALIKPSAGAQPAFERLFHHDFDPDITTARKAPLFDCTDQWLKEYHFWPFVNEIHRRRDNERGVEFKCRIAREYQFAAAFDDTADVVEALSRFVPVVYLINKPWNVDTDFPSNVIRVKSFAEGVDRLLSS